jgi:hypothetical protein
LKSALNDLFNDVDDKSDDEDHDDDDDGDSYVYDDDSSNKTHQRLLVQFPLLVLYNSGHI